MRYFVLAAFVLLSLGTLNEAKKQPKLHEKKLTKDVILELDGKIEKLKDDHQKIAESDVKNIMKHDSRISEEDALLQADGDIIKKRRDNHEETKLQQVETAKTIKKSQHSDDVNNDKPKRSKSKKAFNKFVGSSQDNSNPSIKEESVEENKEEIANKKLKSQKVYKKSNKKAFEKLPKKSLKQDKNEEKTTEPKVNDKKLKYEDEEINKKTQPKDNSKGKYKRFEKRHKDFKSDKKSLKHGKKLSNYEK